MSTAAASRSRRKILVVDDEPLIRDLCTDVLESFQVIQAAQGQEALQILDKEDIQLVLTDVKMPGLSGIELLKQLKLDRPDRSVILMTGYSDKTLILEALKAGADDFISKPIDILQLSTTVDKVMERQALRDEVANLRHLDKLKNEFLGLVSHKLKTPTTAISLFIQNLAEGIENPGDENFQQIVSMVQGETLYLEKLIQDLLYFSEATLQQQELAPKATALNQVVEDVLHELSPLAASRSLQLVAQIEPVPPLQLHPQRIYFAVRALLDNAIKFTPDQGKIDLDCVQQDNCIKLTIRDTGIGIPASELAKIFNKFYQIDPENTGHVRGFGLGLYYARDFVRAMGGQLIIDSQPEHGTTATIEFPSPA